jgi:hypothetical protein
MIRSQAEVPGDAVAVGIRRWFEAFADFLAPIEKEVMPTIEARFGGRVVPWAIQ